MTSKDISKNRIFSSKTLNIVFVTLFVIWLIAQVSVVLTVQNLEQIGDGRNYQRLAENAFAAGNWYPVNGQMENYTVQSGEPTYICYPGLINLLQLYLYLFGTIKAAFWFNILFNCIIAVCIYEIGKTLAGKTHAKIGLCLFFLYPLQVFAVGLSLSEFPCLALAYASILLASRRNYGLIVASGILIILSGYIRTVSLLFAAGVLCYVIIKKYNWKLILCYPASMILTYLMIISFNYSKTGYYFYSSTTLGINMLLGANDGCDGGYNDLSTVDPAIDKEIEGKTTFQIDSLQKAYAYRWIGENPRKWLVLAPAKIAHELRPDTFTNLGRADGEVFDESDSLQYIFVMCIKGYVYIFQFALLITAAWGIWIRRRNLWGVDGAVLLPFLGSLGLTVLTVGNARYNMPFVPILIYFATWAILSIQRKKPDKL